MFDHYVKEREKRDKTGDRAVRRTLIAREIYDRGVEDGTYYERN